MTKRHVHADLIKQWVEDTSLEVECRIHEGAEWKVCTTPNWYADSEYRIKPKIVKREGWINLMGLNVASYVWPTKEEADSLAYERIACIRIEWEEEV